MARIFLPMCFACILWTACEHQSSVVIPPDVAAEERFDTIPVDDIHRVAGISQDFGWKLFQNVARGNLSSNVLISPFSIQASLSMALNGAEGETLYEMLDVLGCWNCSVSDLNHQILDLRALLEQMSGHPELTSVNGCFVDPVRFDMRDAFVEALAEYYHAGVLQRDFNAPAVLDEINDWVEEHTNGKIGELIDEIGKDDLVFLINALHFRADWATAFRGQVVNDVAFRTGDSLQVLVPFIVSDRLFYYTDRPDYRMVDILFKDSTYSFSMILPGPATVTQTDWLQNLSPAAVQGLWASLKLNRAYVRFPKLNLAFEVDLIPSLLDLGMRKAFSEASADFTGMGRALSGGNAHITKVRHKAVLKIDEKGAEGSATTVTGIGLNSVPPTFRFNQPYVIILRHVETNTIVFAGLVNNPSG